MRLVKHTTQERWEIHMKWEMENLGLDWRKILKWIWKVPLPWYISSDMYHKADCNMCVDTSKERFHCQVVVMHVSVPPQSWQWNVSACIELFFNLPPNFVNLLPHWNQWSMVLILSGWDFCEKCLHFYQLHLYLWNSKCKGYSNKHLCKDAYSIHHNSILFPILDHIKCSTFWTNSLFLWRRKMQEEEEEEGEEAKRRGGGEKKYDIPFLLIFWETQPIWWSNLTTLIKWNYVYISVLCSDA